MTDVNLYQQHQSRKQNIEESLSSLVDGEASDLEIRRILKTCDKNPSLRRRWARYQLVSQLLKNSQPIEANAFAVDIDLSERIRSSIAEENAINMRSSQIKTRAASTPNQQAAESDSVASKLKRNVKSMLPDIGRFAVAASVATVVILGAQYSATDDPSSTVTVVASESPAPLSEQVVYEGLVSKNMVQTASYSTNVGKAAIQASKQPMTISSGGLEQSSHDMQDLQQQLNRLMLEHVENVSQNNYQGILPYARVPGGE